MHAPYSPSECNDALMVDNPTYRSLHLTQLPSWVCPPVNYKPNSSSSLVLAFEDPDGEMLRRLLAQRTLYAFGSVGELKRWKQKPRVFIPEHAMLNSQDPHGSLLSFHYVLSVRLPSSTSVKEGSHSPLEQV
ncbi:hypothetical protein EI94DRAFT_1806084 [Lactarius quietus]|nr:hypothetical protein EI94DRAFT_1806084 [Lactarius quietus]